MEEPVTRNPGLRLFARPPAADTSWQQHAQHGQASNFNRGLIHRKPAPHIASSATLNMLATQGAASRAGRSALSVACVARCAQPLAIHPQRFICFQMLDRLRSWRRGALQVALVPFGREYTHPGVDSPTPMLCPMQAQ